MQYNDLIEDTKDLNILYVEDEIGLREGIEKTLFCLFKNVVSSKNGEEAFLEYTKNDKNYFDIVLTDINMPLLDGLVFLAFFFNSSMNVRFQSHSSDFVHVDHVHSFHFFKF